MLNGMKHIEKEIQTCIGGLSAKKSVFLMHPASICKADV